MRNAGLILFLFENCFISILTASYHEEKLIRTLLSDTNYSKKVRPNGIVIVDFRLIFNQIINMIEKEQIMVSNVFVDQKWKDSRLMWNQAEYDNITLLRIPASMLWYPDTFLYNTADNTGYLIPQESQNMVINNNGIVVWPMPLAHLRTRCRMGIKHFPFDEQSCEMVFGSWSHTKKLIQYKFWEEHPELPDYAPNNEWKLLAVKQTIKEQEFANWIEKDPFYEINFTVLIRRKPLQAIYNTVVPALMLTILTLVSFFIPFAQEMQIGISIMLAYSVFSLRLSEDVPSQSDSVHLISLYLTVCMCYSLLAMTWFAFTNKLREKKRLPYWIRWLALDYLAYVVCATNMHRKATRLSPQSTSRTTTRPLPSQHSPLLITQNNNANIVEYSNSFYSETDSIQNHHQFPKLIILPKSQTFLSEQNEPASSQRTSTTINGRRRRSLTPVDLQNETTIWIRRGTVPTTHEFIRHRPNGPCDNTVSGQSTQRKGSRLKSSKNTMTSISKDKESLYAIHIYNRLVFAMFLLFVFVLNIYTWFFYSRLLPSSLNEQNSNWTCFDEKILSVVNCTNDK